MKTFSGTVQILTCHRDGRQCWSKLVYIPASETAEAYKQFACKRHGDFFYNLIGDVRAVNRKPHNVDNWNA